MAPNDKDSRWYGKILTGFLIAFLLIALVAAFFTVKVCDDQVTSRGVVVEVCRHSSSSDPPVVAAVVAVVVLLAGVFFTEVSVLGITAKRQLEEVKGQLEDNAQAAEEVREALHETESDLRERVDLLRTGERGPQEPATDELDRLAQEYNDVRLALPSGDERTDRMTDIIDRMKVATRGRAGFDPGAYLESEDRGRRLIGYAALCVNSHPEMVPRLVDFAIREDKSFGQFWALNALEKQLTYAPFALDSAATGRLQEYLTTIPRRSDRSERVSGILRRFARHLDV